jgi:hypothetical protein
MYTDPGAGGLIIQFLLGALMLIPVFIGLFWNRLKRLIKREKTNDTKNKSI